MFVVARQNERMAGKLDESMCKGRRTSMEQHRSIDGQASWPAVRCRNQEIVLAFLRPHSTEPAFAALFGPGERLRRNLLVQRVAWPFA